MNVKGIVALALLSTGVAILLWLGMLYATVATSFLLCLLIILEMLTPTFSEDEILLALHHAEWRTAKQILGLLARMHKIASWRTTLCVLYPQLADLHDKGLIERRGKILSFLVGQVTHEMEISEYRLLSNGLHRKITIEQSLPSDVPLGEPADKTT